MGSASMCEAGPELGATYYSHIRFDEGVDAMRKVTAASMTFYGTAVVHDPRKLALCFDVMFRGIIGGGNAFFMDLESTYANHRKFVTDVIESVEGQGGSCISAVVGMCEEPENRIDFTGYNPAILSGRSNGHYSSAGFMAWSCGFKGPCEADTVLSAFKRQQALNTIMCRGGMRRFLPSAGTGEALVGTHSQELPNTGHCGYAGHGAKAMRSGSIGPAPGQAAQRVAMA
jgi:hypothetical protein